MKPNKFYWENGAVFLGGMVILTVSFLLTPDPRGFGTHEHLFLPPCFFFWFTHVPCPSCGLTTSFAYLAKGQLSQGASIHPMGPVFFATLLLFMGLALGGLLRRKSFWAWMDKPSSYWISSLLLGAWLLTWIFQVLSHERLLTAVRSF